MSNLIVISGKVNGDGTIGTGTGFSPKKVKDSYYRVEFEQQLGQTPIVLVTLDGDTYGGEWTGAATLHNVQTTSFELSTFDLNVGAVSPAFHFAVIIG